MKIHRLRLLPVILIVAGAALLWIGDRARSVHRTRSLPALNAPQASGRFGVSAAQASSRDRLSDLATAFRALNHGEIVFFGRAVDQEDKPVPDTRVKARVLFNTGIEVGSRPVETVSDAGGYFTLSGLEGQTLAVELEKPGYEFNPNNAVYWYSLFEPETKRHRPDPAHPVMMRMWKLRGAENLIHYDRNWNIPADGSSTRFDLETGRIGAEGADLLVAVSREPLAMPFGAAGFSWNVRIEAVDGGLVRMEPQPYYNLAPEVGYQPLLAHTQVAQRPGERWAWEPGLSTELMVRFKGGEVYARIKLRLTANTDRKEGDNLAGVRMEVWLNPNGSRNLEYDPARAVTPPR